MSDATPPPRKGFRPALLLPWLLLLATGGLGIYLIGAVNHPKSQEPALPDVETAAPVGRGLWTGLVLATLRPNPEPLPPPLDEYEAGLRENFGYDQYTILTEADHLLADTTQKWFVPSEEIYLNSRLLGEKDGTLAINFQVFQRGRLLVDADADMVPGKPLFIKGPIKGHGQLIFVLVAR